MKKKMDELKELTCLKDTETLGLKRETFETKKELEIINYLFY